MVIPILLGSRNPARLEITRQALAGLPARLVSLDEVGVVEDAIEDGVTAVENARLKALFYYRAARLPTLAMDGALHIERFSEDKQPGVLVRRVDGRPEPRTDQELLRYYIAELEAVGGESPARWLAGYALAYPGVGGDEPRVLVEHFVFNVQLVAQPVGQVTPGHSLDPLMREPSSGRPYTEIPIQERPYFQTIRGLVERALPDIKRGIA